MSKSSYIHFYSGRTALASTVQAQNDADDERKKVVLLVLVLVLVLLLLLLLVLLLLLLLLTSHRLCFFCSARMSCWCSSRSGRRG